MTDSFIHARNKLLRDLPCTIIRNRVAQVTVSVKDASDMAKNINGDNYRRYLNIPAYYDPNDHTVFLNRQALTRTSEATNFIICYHELIHGASVHKNYRNERGSYIFQSGVKIERYGKRTYTCKNKLLNEGLVQFFTVHYNQVRANDYGYAQEVRLVTVIAEHLGTAILEQALFYGEYDKLCTEFDAHFGTGSFARFSSALDRRDYRKAESILRYRETLSPSRLACAMTV